MSNTAPACSSCGYNFERLTDGECNSCRAALANATEVTVKPITSTKTKAAKLPAITIPKLVPVTPAPAPEATRRPVTVDLRPQTRNELLVTLKELGYSGPVSFTASTLRLVVEWVEAGRPAGANLPAGVLRFR